MHCARGDMHEGGAAASKRLIRQHIRDNFGARASGERGKSRIIGRLCLLAAKTALPMLEAAPLFAAILEVQGWLKSR
jgi:hypothetical protein